MPMAVRSGKPDELRICKVCKLTVMHTQIVVYIDGLPKSWDAHEHNAPCGLPCIGAGVSGTLYDSGQFHGSDLKSCPACKEADNG